MNSEKLELKKLPFYFGLLSKPGINEFPRHLPFTLAFDEKLGLIVQERNSLVDEWNTKAYEYGSSLSSPLDKSSFGNSFVADIKNALISARGTSSMNGLRFLEIGCGTGAVLQALKKDGAARCVGIEPDPRVKDELSDEGVEILHSFFKPELINESFDVIFTHGVLEHMANPKDFLDMVISAAKPGTVIFNAVPNFEQGLSMGDTCLLGHEHYNYFTPRSLKHLHELAGLAEVKCVKAGYGWMIYSWGKVPKDSTDKKIPSGLRSKKEFAAEKKLFSHFVAAFNKNVAALQSLIKDAEKKGKTIGIYGVYNWEIFSWSKEPRFFDGDRYAWGKYYLYCRNPIEPPTNLKTSPVDLVFITPINYDEVIREYLAKEIGIDPSSMVSFKQIYKKNAEALEFLSD